MARVLSLLLISFLFTVSTSANTRKKRNLELLLEPLIWIERLRTEAELRPLLPSSGVLLHGSNTGGHNHQSPSVAEATTEHPPDNTEHHEHQSNNTEHQSNGSEHGNKENHKHEMHHHHHHHHGGGGH